MCVGPGLAGLPQEPNEQLAELRAEQALEQLRDRQAKLESDIKAQAVKTEATAAQVKSVEKQVFDHVVTTDQHYKELREQLAGLAAQVKLLAEAPKAAPPAAPPLVPPEPDTPFDQIVKSDPPAKTVFINGAPTDLPAYLAKWYRVPWTYPGTIESHLTEHGVTGFESLSKADKEKLHAAIHEQEKAAAPKAPVRVVAAPAPKVVYRATVYSSGCPGGVCPAPQWNGYSSGQYRSRGWFRRR